MSETDDKRRSKRRGADKLAKATGSGTSSSPIGWFAQLAMRTKNKTVKGSIDSAESRGEHKPGENRARINSLDIKKARNREQKQTGDNSHSDPAEESPAQLQHDHPEKSRSRSRRGRDESPSRNRSRRRNSDPTGGRGESRQREERRPRSRGRSRSKNRRRSSRSRLRRSLSRLRGGHSSDESPERERSSTRISSLRSERSILFCKKRWSHRSFEYLVEEGRRGTWHGNPALYLRINIVMGRGKKDFDKAWFKFEFRGEQHSSDAAVVKFYPENIEGPSTPQNREDVRGGDVGVQVSVPATPVGFHATGNGATTTSMVVQHRCRLEVTPYRGSTGIMAHLRKDGTNCTMPSRVQVQLVVEAGVLYGLEILVYGLEILGTLDYQGTNGADGAWKPVHTVSYQREARDFATWTDQDWKSKGNNTPLEGPGTPGR